MGTATSKGVKSIKNMVNQLITTQCKQQETLVHITSVLNVTRYVTQMNRQHINLVTDAVERTHQDITMFYNITSSLYTNLNYQQIVLHICSILANLRDSLYYIETSHHAHAMDYIDPATTCILITSCTTSRRSLENVNTHLKRHYLQPCTYQFN